MITNAVTPPAVTDPTQVRPVEPVKPVQEVAPATSGSQTENGLSNHDRAQSQPAYMLKLTIDKDPDSGEFIYRAIDRYTGEVVRQFPQKELLEMQKSRSYKAGSIVRTDI